MALTGIQIFKLLPKTNCGQCKYPTCLAFAMALAAAKAELDTCPHVGDEARNQLAEASAPPIRPVVVGSGDYEVKVGGETVMFRHEKTFFNKPGIAVLVSSEMDDAEVERRFEALPLYQFERIGLTLRPELVAVRDGGDRGRFLALVRRAARTPYSIALMSFDPVGMEEALKLLKDRRPIIYAATDENWQAMAALAKTYGCPLAVKGNGIERVAGLSEKLVAQGMKDLILDASPATVREAFEQQVIIRRAALISRIKPLGFPTIVFPFELSSDPMKEALIASTLVAKYAGIIVLSDFQGETLFPLLLQRLNIYTDPQRPMTTQEGIYPVNSPGDGAPVLVTCNFSLTYFIVSGEIENSRVPSWLLVMDTEGLSVMTAWAAGKFVGDLVGAFVKRSGIAEKIAHKKLIIPGYAAQILGDLEEELPEWEIHVGPREAAHIPAYLRMWKG
jgi:acetyl-CoA decarbonylase/synthase, CODH/ACS complex subunit gamma